MTEIGSHKLVEETKAEVRRQVFSLTAKLVLFVLGFAAIGWTIILQSFLASFVGGVPKSAIISFLDACPDGWEQVDELNGKYIRGFSRSITTEGGSSEVILTPEYIPEMQIQTATQLNLDIPRLWGMAGPKGEQKLYSLASRDGGLASVAEYPISNLFVGVAQPEAIKITPEYRAMHFCKRIIS